MNIEMLFNSLNIEEKKELAYLVYTWPGFNRVRKAGKIELTDSEKQKLDNNQLIKAIKEIRERTGADLGVCKAACDLYWKGK